MGKKFNLKNVRIKDCITVLDVIGREPKKALAAMGDDEKNPRSLRHLHKLADELEAGIVDYLKVRSEASEEINEVRKPFQDEMDAALKSATNDDEYSLKEKEIGRRAQTALQEADKNVAEKYGLKELHEEISEVKIESDERFNVLKNVLEKEGVNMFSDSKALLEVLDAIDAAESL
ncbi:MAG: hypothetical protein WC364_13785 [Eubacteriales bacterium]|jgi:uncharacterized phage infection (PIP) family protein YhgE